MIDLQIIGLAFLKGLGLIISPCILPILPIILAGVVQSGRKRPFGIIIGFILVFTVLPLISHQLMVLTGIESDMLRHAAYVFLMIFGIILCSTKLSEELSEFTQHAAMTDDVRALRNPSGFFSGTLLGAVIGFIFVPCTGVTGSSILISLGLSVGMSIPILIIALVGQKIIGNLTFMKHHIHKIRKFLGLVIIVTVFMSSGWLNVIKNITFLPKVETGINLKNDTKLINGITPYPAPEIMNIDVWINSETVSLESLKDKVILLNFWTYSCLNCVRTIPYLNELYKKYHTLGLEIIGVHSPEFTFERNLMNVSHAIESNNIAYPIALDNQLSTWRAYQNQSRPSFYLIDKKGNIVYAHVGEGEYDVIENNIRHLLGLSMDNPPKEHKKIEKHSFKVTPETYLGYERMEKFQSSQSVNLDTDKTYSYPPYMRLHHWALKGKWNFGKEAITAKRVDASLIIRFFAKKIFMVMGSENETPINVTFKLNGQSLDKNAGKAVKKSECLVNQQTLYEIIALSQYERGELEIISQTPGLQVYAFAFD
jgi:cytochrome c biogenesis protein CcdA/thiol-disulfide isomerase/thioredoxin